MNYLLSHCLIFFYIYSIKFFFLPLGTRVLLGGLGFILIFIKFLSLNNKIVFDFRYFKYLTLLLLLIPLSFIANLINSTEDYEFVRYTVSILVVNASAYFVINLLLKLNPELESDDLAIFIVNVVFLQSIITLLMFLFFPFKELIYSLQSITSGDIEKLNKVNEFRMIGFGSYFFGAGVIHGFSLILISACLINRVSESNSFIFIMALKFVFILCIGMMMARTTAIGAFFAFLLLLSPLNKNTLKLNLNLLALRSKFLFSLVFFPLFILSVLYITIPQIKNIFEPLFFFVFEAFINYFEFNSFESESTNHLMQMYVFPNNLLTWVIGDGLWTASNGLDYYMGSDVGYVRLLFYFGIIGTFLYFMIHIYLVVNAFYRKVNLVFIISLYFLFLNLKGFTDLTPLLLIFWFLIIIKRPRVTNV